MFTQKGMTLVVSLIFLLIISILGVSIASNTAIEKKMVVNQKMVSEALSAAESGVMDGVHRLVAQTVSDSGNETNTNWSVSNLSTTGFSSGITNDFQIKHKVSNGVVVTDSEGKPFYVITSNGHSFGVDRTVETIVSLKYVNDSVFKKGLIGCVGLSLKGMETASYKSSDTSYTGFNGDAATLESNSFVDISHNADIKGSVYAAGNITLSQNSKIRGAALSGGNISNTSSQIFQKASAAGSVSGNGLFSGGMESNLNPSPVNPSSCDPLDVGDLWTEAAAVNGGSGSDITISSDTTVNSGVYDYANFSFSTNKTLTVNGDVKLVVSGNFQMNSNARIDITAGSSLTIYVNGNFVIDGNSTINNPGAPANMVVYSNAVSSSATDVKVTIKANNDLNAIVYAPNAAVAVSSSGSGIYKGALWGKYIEPATSNSNFKFSYDEDLANSGVGGVLVPNDFRLSLWDEK